jgi:hypothetical protein
MDFTSRVHDSMPWTVFIQRASSSSSIFSEYNRNEVKTPNTEPALPAMYLGIHLVPMGPIVIASYFDTVLVGSR